MRAELEAVRAEYALRRNELKRIEALAAKAANGATEVDKALTGFTSVREKLVIAESALQQAEINVRATELEQQKQQRESTIRAAEATIELLGAKADLIHVQQRPKE